MPKENQPTPRRKGDRKDLASPGLSAETPPVSLDTLQQQAEAPAKSGTSPRRRTEKPGKLPSDTSSTSLPQEGSLVEEESRPASLPSVSGVAWMEQGQILLLNEVSLNSIGRRLAPQEVRRLGIRAGDFITVAGTTNGLRNDLGGYSVVEAINGVSVASKPLRRPYFDDLTAVHPRQRITLETGSTPISVRLIDLFCPLGFGQRALLVAPPKAGKSTLIREIAQSILKAHPNAVVIVCVVGERPEEVTELRETVATRGGLVYASSFDEEVSRHSRPAEIALERAKRQAELGKDAIILLDSLTRLARAHNLDPRNSQGRSLSGGIDPQALEIGRRAFGAARALEEGGSVTIVATCLVETGSRLDEVVYEEFKGTGNMELRLSRALAERRIFPAIDLPRSSTRREELLLSAAELTGSTIIRRHLASGSIEQAASQLISALARTNTNAGFLASLSRQ